MRTVYLDCRACSGRQTLHQALAHSLCFPQWYGGNLDALHDCLTDVHTPVRLTVAGVEALGDYAAGFRRVLKAAEQENPAIRIELRP